MSTPREIVTSTLDFTHPERVARSFGDSDFVWSSPGNKTYATDWYKDKQDRWVRFDEWGNRWGRLDNYSKGEVIDSVLASLNDISNYQLPDYSHITDYECVKQVREQCPDHWLIGSLPGFTFNIARKLRRIDHYLLELAAEPDAIHALNDEVDMVLSHMIQNFALSGVDCVMFPEDWGTQRNTLISLQMWRKEFFPRFKSLCHLAHRHGIKVFMHSCGQITTIMPDLIEAGIDVFQFDQPDLHGIDVLANYQKKHPITFWCPVDIQKTLQSKSEPIIREKAREMLDKLWAGRGGFIAGYYSDNESIGLDPQWQSYASNEFYIHGVAARY